MGSQDAGEKLKKGGNKRNQIPQTPNNPPPGCDDMLGKLSSRKQPAHTILHQTNRRWTETQIPLGEVTLRAFESSLIVLLTKQEAAAPITCPSTALTLGFCAQPPADQPTAAPLLSKHPSCHPSPSAPLLSLGWIGDGEVLTQLGERQIKPH